MTKHPWLLSVVAALAGVLAAGVFMARDEVPPAPDAPRVRPAKPRGAPTPSALRPALIQIPDGTYTVGSPREALTWDKPRRAEPNELPQRQVTVSGLWMCETEVTQGQYQAVMGVNPSRCEDGCTYDIYSEPVMSPTRCQNDCAPDMPVNMVGWEDALNYLNRLTILESVAQEAEGLPSLSQCYLLRRGETYLVSGCTGFRLPTEDEWEVSARAGTTTSWAWGEDPGQAEGYGWGYLNVTEHIQPVAGLSPNVWGLYDMAGNLKEWVWTPGPHGSAPAGDPPPRWDVEYAEEWLWNQLIPYSSPIVLPDEADYHDRWRRARGGDIWDEPREFRPASRAWWQGDEPNPRIGLRCARGPTP